MKRNDIDGFLEILIRWVKEQPDIHLLAMVGSYARGEENASSDLDLILLAEDPDIFIKNWGWIKSFGDIERHSVEDWGKVTCLRAYYSDGFEIEFGFSNLVWASDQQDQGTKKVIQDGIKILYSSNAHLTQQIRRMMDDE